MTSYKLVTKYTSPNQSAREGYGYPSKPSGTGLHWWGLPEWNQKLWDVVNYLCDGNRPNPTSAHYVVSDDTVVCIVAPNRAAWHAGTAFGNGACIGIEVDPNLPGKTMETLISLCADIERHYGGLFYYGHRDFLPTQCPGVLYDKMGYIIDKINANLKATKKPSGKSATLKPSIPPKAILKQPNLRPTAGLFWKVERGDTLGKIAKHYGIGTRALVKHNKLASANKITVGQYIRIPGPLVWTVDPGDTLGGIANYYGLDWKVIAASNGIRDPKSLRVGQVLRII